MKTPSVEYNRNLNVNNDDYAKIYRLQSLILEEFVEIILYFQKLPP